MKIVLLFLISIFIFANSQSISCTDDNRITLTKSSVIGTPIGDWIWQTNGNDKVIQLIAFHFLFQLIEK